jgi:uncharacterized membrane protein YbhN (UPF0104 family)
MMSKKSFFNSKLWTVIKIAFALGLFAYILAQTNYEQLVSLKYRFSWGWFIVTALVFFVMLLIKTYQYYIFIGRKLGYFHLLEIVVIQNLLMNFVATAAGIASYLTMLGVEEDVRFGKATESFVLVKLGDVVAVSLYLLFSLIFIRPLPTDALPIVVIVALASLFFLLILFASIIFREKFLALLKIVVKFFRFFRFGLVQKAFDYLEKLVAYSRIELLRIIGHASLISLVYMGVTMFWGYARFRNFSLELDVFAVIFIISLLQFASWVPIYIFGGLGLSEGIYIYLLGIFSPENTALAAILIGMRVVSYLLNASTLLYLPVRAAFQSSSTVK